MSIGSTTSSSQVNILSRNNLTLCKANYMETCWCSVNQTEPISCPYLLRHVNQISNASHFCVYHTIRLAVDCFNVSVVYPKSESISRLYTYSSLFLFIIGLIGNGFSMIILSGRTLRSLSVYRNLFLLCSFNIFYLFAVLIRHSNNYHRDLREISSQFCRWHTFAVAFTGHLCSWQLVSTSIQRVNALLSLELPRPASWKRTWTFLLFGVVFPLFLFDGQLIFNYGLLKDRHMCDHVYNVELKKFQRAVDHPLNSTAISLTNIPIRYHRTMSHLQLMKFNQCTICILWNILDTLIYALLPFALILTCSLIIIVKICQRRRSMILHGGKCHRNRQTVIAQDNLSILLITINCLFLIMTGPFNLYLIIQSIGKYCSKSSIPTKPLQQMNLYLRLLQNSYHALSFIFYCVIGNKFRHSAWILFQRLLGKSSKRSMCCCVQSKSSRSTSQTLTTALMINLPTKLRSNSTRPSREKLETCL